MAQLYSGKGDDGSTGLLGGGRVSKANLMIEAIGSLDEVNAFLGNVRNKIHEKNIQSLLEEIQRDLYTIMADLANSEEIKIKTKGVDISRVHFLEKQLEEIGGQTEMPKGFILPGETSEAVAIGICRTVTRRAERQVVRLSDQQGVKNPQILSYLNRLSSLLYLLEVKYSQKQNSKKFKYAKVT